MANRLHPLEKVRLDRGWIQKRAAKHFRVPYPRYRQVVNGYGGVSLDTAQAWASRSGGAFDAMDVLLWHKAHRKPAPESAAA